MELRKEIRPLLMIAGVFLIFFYLPVGSSRFDNAVMEAIALTQWYAREHVILCLLPAFFIAGAIAVFISQASVMKYLGAKANKVLSYGVASVSGSILAVCSCTVLPLFAGIYRMGAGLGPATAFLYAGPAVNVLAIILTARVLGVELGVARAVGAVLFSILVGLMMHLMFRSEENEKIAALDAGADDYLTKPFGTGELMARIRAALRHSVRKDNEPVIEIDQLKIDLERRQVMVADHEISLTPTEYDILRLLAQNLGKVLTHHQLLQKVWGVSSEEDLHLLRVNISNLRHKIEPDPSRPHYIRTEAGVGYRLRAEP